MDGERKLTAAHVPLILISSRPDCPGMPPTRRSLAADSMQLNNVSNSGNWLFAPTSTMQRRKTYWEAGGCRTRWQLRLRLCMVFFGTCRHLYNGIAGSPKDHAHSPPTVLQHHCNGHSSSRWGQCQAQRCPGAPAGQGKAAPSGGMQPRLHCDKADGSRPAIFSELAHSAVVVTTA